MAKKNKPQILIHNVETGEVELRDLTDEEIEAESNSVDYGSQVAAKEAARQSALAKLAELGLTEAEIQALAG